MISSIRKYIKSQVSAVDSDFKEWKDVFNIENIPSNIYNKSYHLIYSINSTEKLQGIITYSIGVTLTLFYKADRTVQDNFDLAMDTANDISLRVCNIHNVYEFQEVEDLDAAILDPNINSIIPSNPVSNDNRIIITMEFSFILNQSIC